MNVGIGTVAEQFLFWEYFFGIFGIVSLQYKYFIKSLLNFGRFGYFWWIWGAPLVHEVCCFLNKRDLNGLLIFQYCRIMGTIKKIVLRRQHREKIHE